MSTITPHYRTVQQLLQSQTFSIDEYQREYKWEKENIEELINDLRDKFSSCYVSGHETVAVSGYEDYFLGSIIVSKRAGKSYLIDGQQRVTSLTLLLIHLYRTARQNQWQVAQILAHRSSSVTASACPNSISTSLSGFRSSRRCSNGDDYSPDGTEESIQTMYARYQDIVRAELAEELKDALPHFIYWLMNKVGLIEIATDNDPRT